MLVNTLGLVNIFGGSNPVVTDVNSGLVLDGEATATFSTTGFTGEITSVQLIGGGTTNCTNIASTSGNGTFDIPVIPLGNSRLTTANTSVIARISDGIDTVDFPLTYSPQSTHAVVEAINAVKTKGSVFENFVGVIPDNSQTLYPIAFGTSVLPDGTLQTSATSDIVMGFGDFVINTWVGFSATISAADAVTIQSLNGVSQAAVGVVSIDTVTGSITQQLGTVSQNASGLVTSTPASSGNVVQALNGVSQTAVGIVSSAGSVVGGTQQTLSAVSQLVVGVVTADPPISGGVVQQLGLLTQVSSGAVSSVGSVTGSAAHILNGVTQLANGVVTPEPPISGGAIQQLAGISQNASGVVTAPGSVAANVVQALQALTQSVIGVVNNGPVATGDIVQMLGTVSQAASGTVTDGPPPRIGDGVILTGVFSTGGSVTVGLVDPVTDTNILLSDATAYESTVFSTLYVWDTSKIAVQPLTFTEYLYTMTDGVDITYGKISVGVDILPVELEKISSATQVKILSTESFP